MRTRVAAGRSLIKYGRSIRSLYSWPESVDGWAGAGLFDPGLEDG